MFSTTIKRSAATLGVAAGLLAAAAVPASAMPAGTFSAPNDALTAVKAPTNAGTQVNAPSGLVGTSEVFELNTLGGGDTLHAPGTQVGSEGIWAPGDGSDYIWAPGDGSDYVKGNNGPPAR